MNKYKKIIITILTIILVGCLVSACFLIVRQALQDKRAEQNLETLRQTVETTESKEQSVDSATIGTDDSGITATPSAEQIDAEAETNSPTEESTDASSDNTVTVSPIPNPYKDVFSANRDIAAWLIIPDTVIDYPVMWTPEDENYYLYRDVYGNDDKNGSLILDTDSSLDPLTTNLIIHGHNMRSGAMFGNLTDYESQDYCREHQKITLYTKECQRNYEVIAVFRSQVYKKKDDVFKYYKFFQADTPEEFDDFYQNIKKLSLYDTGVTAEFGDHFITLSTCVYHVEQGRFVVVAKEVENGDIYLPMQDVEGTNN